MRNLNESDKSGEAEDSTSSTFAVKMTAVHVRINASLSPDLKNVIGVRLPLSNFMPVRAF